MINTAFWRLLLVEMQVATAPCSAQTIVPAPTPFQFRKYTRERINLFTRDRFFLIIVWLNLGRRHGPIRATSHPVVIDMFIASKRLVQSTAFLQVPRSASVDHWIIRRYGNFRF